MKMRYEKCMKSKAFTDPKRKIQDEYLKLEDLLGKIEASISEKVHNSKIRYVELISKLDALSPLKTLKRGYCISEVDGIVIKSAKDLKENMEIDLKYVDGSRKAKVL